MKFLKFLHWSTAILDGLMAEFKGCFLYSNISVRKLSVFVSINKVSMTHAKVLNK